MGVPLTLSALARVPGEPLLTTLPGTFVVLAPRQLLSPAAAAALPLAATSALQGGVGGVNVEGQLNGASIILGNIQARPYNHSVLGKLYCALIGPEGFAHGASRKQSKP